MIGNIGKCFVGNIVIFINSFLGMKVFQTTIFFTTVRKFKGLEAEVIICIDIDKETFSSPQERNVFYVGTSRAMAYLDLLSLSSPEELATAIDGGEIYSKRPQAIKAVRDCLKVKIASAFDLTDDMDS